METLKSYVNSHAAIDSTIYLYSEFSNLVATNTYVIPSQQLQDTTWCPFLTEEAKKQSVSIVLREKNGYYP